MVVRDISRVNVYFEEGWHDFVEDNGIEIGDRLDLLYLGDRLFKVVIWRDGIDITRNCIVISSNSSYWSDSSDSDDEISVQCERPYSIISQEPRCLKLPEFEDTFTKAYSAVGMMNVPLEFARRHFNRFGASKPAELWVNKNKKWRATLFLKRGSKQQIILSNIKKEVKEMIRGENIKVGQKVIVQLQRTAPLVFKVSRL